MNLDHLCPEHRDAFAAHLLQTRRSCALAYPDLTEPEREERAIRHAVMRTDREREQRSSGELEHGINRVAWHLNIALEEVRKLGHSPLAALHVGAYLARAADRSQLFEACREEYARASILIDATREACCYRILDEHARRLTPEPRVPKKRSRRKVS